MTTAVLNEGIVNMAAPQFDVQVVDTAENQYGFHLWYMDERKGYPYNL